ncbi:MAG: hypothetical protein ACTH6I_01745 [Vibrio litoralis]|uniref:hypothetical protein n=1 Tax=Vibrio litoralis TaxID=335972 RepID=UPI003F967ED2
MMKYYSHDEVLLQQSLDSLMQLSESLANEGQIALSGVVWRLYCSLLQLQQVNVADNGKSLELKTQS